MNLEELQVANVEAAQKSLDKAETKLRDCFVQRLLCFLDIRHLELFQVLFKKSNTISAFYCRVLLLRLQILVLCCEL